MPHAATGAQRASAPRLRTAFIALLVALLSFGALGAAATPAQAATYKVVIVVGPTGSQTSNYITNARKLATQARGYGASVTEVYSPNATWARVASAAKGANVLIYLGHGNGWPSPYAPFSRMTKDGMGLNKAAGAGHYNHRYYGEYYMQRLALAPNAVVILNRLCYASGNSEWGRANPTKSVAIQRVDNYGAGFLRSGAKAVFASGTSSVGYVLKGLFRGSASMTMAELFWSDPSATRSYRFTFKSVRTPGMTASMDPTSPGRYYRSVIGNQAMTVGDWR